MDFSSPGISTQASVPNHKGQTHGPERDLVRNLLLVTPLRNRFYVDSFTADLTSTLE
jgi:hypothetical protein